MQPSKIMRYLLNKVTEITKYQSRSEALSNIKSFNTNEDSEITVINISISDVRKH